MTTTTPPTDPSLNTVTWWEIPVADLDEAARFYPAVFGWTVAPFGDGYLAVNLGDRMIGGLFASSEEPAGGGVRIYVNVADLEQVLAAATAAGGTVITPRTLIAEGMGWWAELADPSGRRLGLCSDRDAGA
ncbi:VOC family protein [Nakamurella deserti]|uniref:VOC family protein n=1 Tax=Nakamurella deserti TaxID=2164074 RepID=UPI000DBEA49C|nr:VOC family protein [Nakamurella deserti]